MRLLFSSQFTGYGFPCQALFVLLNNIILLNDGKILIICFVNFALSFVTLSPSHNSKWPPLLSFQFKLKYIPKVTCFLSPFSG